jgi:hypothetical protein
MRWAQGGKFEHGFLSGFVSSLGGSYMQSNGGNIGIGDKVILSAIIGGTAEALGGGKFTNGAVTGAYVMMFNHLSHKWHPTRKEAAEATRTRTETTGNEANYLVYKGDDGEECYWEVPPDTRDGPGISYWNEPEEAYGLTLTENYHYSKGIITDVNGNTGKAQGSYQDWRVANEYNIKVTHHSIGIGVWIFKPSIIFTQPISVVFWQFRDWNRQNPIMPRKN